MRDSLDMIIGSLTAAIALVVVAASLVIPFCVVWVIIHFALKFW